MSGWVEDATDDDVRALIDGEPHEPGDVEQKTRAYVDELGDLDGHCAPLAATACALARAIDRGLKDTAFAPTARELRETLKAIAEAAGGGDDDAAIMAQLSKPDVPAAMGNAPKP